MDFELQLREAVKEQDPGDTFTTKVMAGVDGAKVIDIRSRMPRKIVLAGALLVAVAAAAMLAVGLQGPESRQLEEAVSQPAIAEQSRADEEVAAIDMPRSTANDSIGTTPDSAAAASPMEAAGRLTVLVMPVADKSGAPGAGLAAEAFLAELVRDFRGMNDLVILDSTADSATAARADFRLTVSSLEWRRPTPGMVEVISTTGGFFSSGTPYRSEADPQQMPGLGEQYWPVEAKIEEARITDSSGGKLRDFTVSPFSGANGIRQPETPCSMGGSLMRTGTSSMQWLGRICGPGTAIASGLADVMHQRSMPVPATPQPATPSANAATVPRPGYNPRLLSNDLGFYHALMGMAGSVEKAAKGGKPAEDIESQYVRYRFSLDEKELVKLDRYLRVALRSDRDNQARQLEEICSRKAEFRNLDQFGAAMNELSRNTELHQETLGREAATELGPELFAKLSERILAERSRERTPRETTSYDFPAMFKAQNRVLETEIERLCNFGK